MKEEQEPGWNKKHGYLLPPPVDNPAVRWGLAFEDAIMKLVEEKEGCEVINREKLSTKQIGGYGGIILSCHQDGQFASGYHAHPVLFEGKTTNHWAYTSTRQEIIDRLGDDGQLENGFNTIRRWGEPGTDQTPQEYTVQGAVQRICTGAELVKLSVLVFPKAQQDYEDMGWTVTDRKKEGYTIFEKKSPIGEEEEIHKDDEINFYRQKQGVHWFNSMYWAHALAQMGNFHTYNLPSHEALETEIIKAVTRFDRNHMQPGIPPDPSNWDDVRRLITQPVGTIIAPAPLTKKLKEISELVKSLGSTSPAQKRLDKLKLETIAEIQDLQRSDPIAPPDALEILDPDGGDKLATLKKNKNGVLTFRAQRAK